MFCTICRNEIPADRLKRKGFAGATCSDECYAEFRRKRREQKRDKRVYLSPKKWARVLRFEAEQRTGRQAALQKDGGVLRSGQTVSEEQS